MKLRFHSAAREEARQAYRYYARIDEALAQDFEVRLTEALNKIAHYPEAYPVRRYNVRRCNLVRFKMYYVAYTILDDHIQILAIGHGWRHPYYWHPRTEQNQGLG